MIDRRIEHEKHLKACAKCGELRWRKYEYAEPDHQRCVFCAGLRKPPKGNATVLTPMLALSGWEGAIATPFHSDIARAMDVHPVTLWKWRQREDEPYRTFVSHLETLRMRHHRDPWLDNLKEQSHGGDVRATVTMLKAVDRENFGGAGAHGNSKGGGVTVINQLGPGSHTRGAGEDWLAHLTDEELSMLDGLRRKAVARMRGDVHIIDVTPPPKALKPPVP